MDRGKEAPMELSVQPSKWSLKKEENADSNLKRDAFDGKSFKFNVGTTSTKPNKIGRRTFNSSLKLKDEGSEDEDIFDNKPFYAKKKKSKWFSNPMKHLYLPYIVMGYLQLFFNLFMIGLMVYLLVQFIRTVQRDVDIKVEEYLTGLFLLLTLEILSEISHCSKQYIENRCLPAQRVPAMEKSCIQWENCMNRDPAIVGRAKVSAETFAEIINSFVEPISYKTMAFFSVMVFGFLFLSNYAFGYARSKVANPFNHATKQASDINMVTYA